MVSSWWEIRSSLYVGQRSRTRSIFVFCLFCLLSRSFFSIFDLGFFHCVAKKKTFYNVLSVFESDLPFSRYLIPKRGWKSKFVNFNFWCFKNIANFLRILNLQSELKFDFRFRFYSGFKSQKSTFRRPMLSQWGK